VESLAVESPLVEESLDVEVESSLVEESLTVEVESPLVESPGSCSFTFAARVPSPSPPAPATTASACFSPGAGSPSLLLEVRPSDGTSTPPVAASTSAFLLVQHAFIGPSATDAAASDDNP